MKTNKIYSGIAYDTLINMGYKVEDFYIDIKPKAGYSGTIVGEAFTTYGEVVSNNDDYVELDNIRLEIYKKKYFINSPIVVLQSNDAIVAHSGDITSLIYKKLGSKGFITDGNVRDIDNINKINFPIFCNNENPIDAVNYWALTKYNINIVIKGVEIRPKDLIIASLDGVIRIKCNDIKTFEKFSFSKMEKENNIRRSINKLNDLDNLISLVKKKGRW